MLTCKSFQDIQAQNYAEDHNRLSQEPTLNQLRLNKKKDDQ